MLQGGELQGRLSFIKHGMRFVRQNRDMRSRVLLVLVLFTLACRSYSQENSAATALDKLRSLAGEWKGTFEWSGARSDKGAMDATYYITGAGSAVVENLVQDGKPVMTSVYHLAGSDLRLTHFCAAGNQPRLKASGIDLKGNAVEFAFVDATNMRTPDAPHVSGLEWRMLDANHITLTFLFEAGEKHSRELIQLTRKQGKNTT
jgi:hypothetical protein